MPCLRWKAPRTHLSSKIRGDGPGGGGGEDDTGALDGICEDGICEDGAAIDGICEDGAALDGIWGDVGSRDVGSCGGGDGDGCGGC